MFALNLYCKIVARRTTLLTVERSPLIVGSRLQVLQQERSQIFRTRKVRCNDTEQTPAPLTGLRLVVGRLLHQLAVNFVPQAFEFMAMLQNKRDEPIGAGCEWF